MSMTTSSAWRRRSSGRHRNKNDERLWRAGTLGLLIVGGLLRFWAIGRDPGMELDEGVYWRVADNLLSGHSMTAMGEYPGAAFPHDSYLSHPPFHFLALASWMFVVGDSITSARIFASVCSLVAIAISARALREVFGTEVSLLGTFFLVTMSWLVFENRIAWLENSQFILVAGVFVLFWRAQSLLTVRAWAYVGLCLGGVIIYKHTGAAMAIAVLLAMMLIRRYTPNWWQALAAVAGSCIAVVTTYFVIMTVVFGSAFTGQTFHQFTRAKGGTSSPGSMELSFSSLMMAMATPYWLFIGTGLIVGAAVSVGFWRAWRVLRHHDSWENTEILWSSMMGCLFALLALKLRFPHYFMMVFWPAGMYLAVETYLAYKRQQLFRGPIVFLVTAATVLNLFGATARMQWDPDNAIAESVAWMNQNYRVGDVLVGDESIGNQIDFRYCTGLQGDSTCFKDADWVETYTSHTQKLTPRKSFVDLVYRSQRCASWRGFREQITVYAVPPRTCPSTN